MSCRKRKFSGVAPSCNTSLSSPLGPVALFETAEESEHSDKKRMLKARLDAALELIDLEVEERIDQFQLSSEMLISKLENTFKRQVALLLRSKTFQTKV